MNVFVFSVLCFICIILPIPLGSFRPWAILSIAIVINSLFLVHLWLSYKQKISLLPNKKTWWLLITLAIVCVVLLIQLVPGLGQTPVTSLTPLAANFGLTASFGINALNTISIDPDQTRQTLLITWTMLLFSWLCLSYCISQERLKSFIYAIVAGGVIQALYATYLNLNPELSSLVFSFPSKERAMGSFTYQNLLANYLALTLAIGVGLLISQLAVKATPSSSFKNFTRAMLTILMSPKFILRLSLILMVIGLILTRSRMGNSAFFISLALMSVVAFFFYNKRPTYLRSLIISFFVLDLLIVGAMFGIDKVKERLVETSLSSETRDEVVRDSIPIIKEHLFLGTGGGTFYTAFPQYKPEAYSGYYDHAHNDYIEFAVTLGVPTTLLLGLLLLHAFYTACKTFITRKTAIYQGIAFGGSIAVLHMVLHSTVDYSFQAGANSFTFIAILCLIYLSASLPAEKKRRSR